MKRSSGPQTWRTKRLKKADLPQTSRLRGVGLKFRRRKPRFLAPRAEQAAVPPVWGVLDTCPRPHTRGPARQGTYWPSSGRPGQRPFVLLRSDADVSGKLRTAPPRPCERCLKVRRIPRSVLKDAFSPFSVERNSCLLSGQPTPSAPQQPPLVPHPVENDLL